jgi:periplasmic divalent cation tolerance protein
MAAIVVVTTVGTEEEANLISQEIIARRQAACVNILHGVRSVYRWKGKICKDSELVLMIKTMEEEFEAVRTTILEFHNYELPEILAFNVTQGDDRFLEWIAGSLDKQAEFFDEVDEEEPAFADPED